MLQEAAITASANKDFFMEDRSPISGKPTPPHLRYVNRCEFEFEIVSVNRVNERIELSGFFSQRNIAACVQWRGLWIARFFSPRLVENLKARAGRGL
jgi:hypothetical protein